MRFLKNIFNFCRDKISELVSNLNNLDLANRIKENIFNFKKTRSRISIYINMPTNLKEHIFNLIALIIPYFVVSLIVYPTFVFNQFFQELFSLICIYCAILFLFMDKLSDISRYRIVIGVTACSVPIIFFNNSFAVALISICLMIFIEFICIEYLKGCFLFSNKIPVYVVCNNSDEADFINSSLKDEYKILEFIIIKSKNEKSEKANLKNIYKLKGKLKKFNWLSFFPFPRRILYFWNVSDTFVNSSDNSKVIRNIFEEKKYI